MLRSYLDSMCILIIFQIFACGASKCICNPIVFWVYIPFVFACGAPISFVFQLYSDSIFRILPRGASISFVFHLYLRMFAEFAPAAPQLDFVYFINILECFQNPRLRRLKSLVIDMHFMDICSISACGASNIVVVLFIFQNYF